MVMGWNCSHTPARLIKFDRAAVPDYANHQLVRQYLARGCSTLYDKQVDDDRSVSWRLESED